MSEAVPEVPGYRVLSVVGRGAMATVYRAQHERLGKTVALKIMDPVVAEDDEYRERFLREARAAAKLNHQNLVRALDSGFANGVYYLAMELVEGDDLRKRIENEGKVPEHFALKAALSVAHALEEASRHGIVHRDVKPENILISQDGTVKLADLGLAKVKDEDGTLTKKGLTVGTVAYFAPEQALGQPDLDVRTDIYALGATLYAALSGELPFGRGENAPETMKRILTEPPPALAEIAPWTSTQARALVEKFMDKERKRRPQTARDAVRAIEACMRGEMPGARTSSRRSSKISSSRGSTRASRRRSTERAFAKPPRSVGLGIAAIGTVAGLVIGIVVLAIARSSDAPAATAPRPDVAKSDPGHDPSQKALEADTTLRSILKGHVDGAPDGTVTIAYDGVPRPLADFEDDDATAPEVPQGELTLRLDGGQRCRFVHKAVLRAPVSVELELLVKEAAPEARFEALLADPRGASIRLVEHGALGEWQNGWPLEAPDKTRLASGAPHRVLLELTDARAKGGVDGTTSWEAAPEAQGPVRLVLEAQGSATLEVRHLTIRGRVDKGWADRAGPAPRSPATAPSAGEAPR